MKRFYLLKTGLLLLYNYIKYLLLIITNSHISDNGILISKQNCLYASAKAVKAILGEIKTCIPVIYQIRYVLPMIHSQEAAGLPD